MTMDISVYSFTAVCQRASAMMPDGGSLLTLTYYGAEKVMPHYNVMGLAKARAGNQRAVHRRGPRQGRHSRQRHLGRADQDARASSGIGDFRYIMKWNELNHRSAGT